MSFGKFAGNFLGAFAQGRALKERSEDDKKERDAKVKLYELELKKQQAEMQSQIQQQQARGQLLDKMQGTETLPGTGVKLMDPTAKSMSLTDLLADPESAMQLLQSGLVKADDIMQQQGAQANRAMIERVMGGGAGGPTGNMELQGVKIGPRGELMPDFGQPQVTSPQTVMGPNGPELATFDPRTGQRVATLGTPKPDTVAPETAGRLSGLVQAQEIAGQIKGKYIKPDGTIDRGLVFTSFANVPGSSGRQIRNDIKIAVDAVLRARTGSGVNASEQKDVIEQFLPNPLDGDELIAAKLGRLDQFVHGTLDIATLPPSIRKRLEEADKKSGGGGPKVIDFNSLPK